MCGLCKLHRFLLVVSLAFKLQQTKEANCFSQGETRYLSCVKPVAAHIGITKTPITIAWHGSGFI